MKIMIMERNIHQGLPEKASVIEGKCYSDLVRALQVLSPFMGDTPQEYMAQVFKGLRFKIALSGDLEEQGRLFVRTLAQKGLVGFVVENVNPELPENIWEAILLIRETGLTNMFDYPKVAELMNECGYKIESEWVLQNRVRYMELIFGGKVELIERLPCADK